eukprot:2587895-Amphidinium_carterae.1
MDGVMHMTTNKCATCMLTCSLRHTKTVKLADELYSAIKNDIIWQLTAVVKLIVFKYVQQSLSHNWITVQYIDRVVWCWLPRVTPWVTAVEMHWLLPYHIHNPSLECNLLRVSSLSRPLHECFLNVVLVQTHEGRPPQQSMQDRFGTCFAFMHCSCCDCVKRTCTGHLEGGAAMTTMIGA